MNHGTFCGILNHPPNNISAAISSMPKRSFGTLELDKNSLRVVVAALVVVAIALFT